MYAVAIYVARPDPKRPTMEIKHTKASSMSQAMDLVKKSFKKLIQNYQECTSEPFRSYYHLSEVAYEHSYMDNPLFNYTIFDGTNWVVPIEVRELFNTITGS